MDKAIRYVDDVRPAGQWWERTPCTRNPTTGGAWTEAKTSTANGITMQDQYGGIALLDPTTSTPATNDADVLYTTKKIFDWADGNIMGIRGRFKIAQANTNKLNFFFGITTVQATTMLANGGGPATTFDGAGIYVSQLGTTPTAFGVIESIGSTQSTTVTTQTAAATVFQELRVEIKCFNTTQATALFWLNGNQLLDANGIDAMFTFTYTGGGKMAGFVGIKSGSATEEALYLQDLTVYGNYNN